ncbi:MAG: hypothetical protein KKG59_04540 [Nanoarchaeota archaeon]|nr:hypothetical protein [Nanoarchaeota archaeon]
MTNCFIKSCKNKSTIMLSYINRGYCDKHFMELIEKRVRKELRVNKIIDVKKKYNILADNSKEFLISKYILNSIFGRALKLEVVNEIKSKNTIVPTNMDREINSMFDAFLKNKSIPQKIGITILDNVLDEELMHIAKILNIKNATQEDRLALIEEVNSKHLIKFSLKKSLNHVREMENGKN